ncbi:aldehyde dehydrogenase [Nadsonia fulvescens var. elongata DSM 6958]|uniref:Aldehyde dehydrogenase n=1 Tax=Nadsonia fulvescens var. elongata DSM 6958 TaxID=857566 RepID=A0A1E3PGL7_9ASCO|nr:aldehyde dehydrogenase [Nadsonia fulvescens var. elongata DSM 6958]
MALQYTSLTSIPGIVAHQRAEFQTFKTIPIQYRLNQLRNLYFAIKDNQELLVEALRTDLNKPAFETYVTEINYVLSETSYIMKNLAAWSKDEPIKDTSMLFKFSSPFISKQPFGTVCVIAPWNYPINLTISPIIGAIAAGNTVVLKLSEVTPNVSRVLTTVLTHALEESIFSVVNGAIDETTVLLEQKFDKIFFTGNGTVGRLVSEAAAKQLTPVILELGGKSPAFVTKNCPDLKVAARRLLWGKFTNSGQTCVAPDYVLIEKEVKPEFFKRCKEVMKEFYPEGVTKDTEFTHIASTRHYNRLKSLMDKTKGDIVIGGEGWDEAAKFVPPTIIDNVQADDSLMQDELFGPILPFITITSIQEGIDILTKNHDTPLSLYIFSADPREQEYIISHTRSGGVLINDTLVHVGLIQAPFGGCGESGSGSYHGKYSFDCFSHSRTVVKQSIWIEFLLKARYAPYTKKNLSLIKFANSEKEWFGREGHIREGRWLNFWYVSSAVILGASSGVYWYLNK